MSRTILIFLGILIFNLSFGQIEVLQDQVNALVRDMKKIERTNEAQAKRITELEQQVTALNALNGSSANFQQLIGASVVPVGTIMPYYGDLDALPSNWMLCNGNRITDPGSPLYRQRAPELDGYFIRGTDSASDVNKPGGQDKISGHSHSIPSHRHKVGDHTHTIDLPTSRIKHDNWSFDYGYKVVATEGYNGLRFIAGGDSESDLYHQHNVSGRTSNASSGYTDNSGTLSSSNAGAHDNRPHYRSFYYIIKIRNFERPDLGITPQELNSRVASQLGIARTQGIYIKAISAGGAAAGTGLKQGDIIIEVDGIITIENGLFEREIAKHQIGDRIQLTIIRGSKEQTVTVTLKAKLKTGP